MLIVQVLRKLESRMSNRKMVVAESAFFLVFVVLLLIRNRFLFAEESDRSRIHSVLRFLASSKTSLPLEGETNIALQVSEEQMYTDS